MRPVSRTTAGIAMLLCASTAAAEPVFSVVRPAEGAAVALARPTIVFGFGRGSVDTATRARVRALIDGVDLTEFAVWSGDRVEVTPPLRLVEGLHVAELRFAGASPVQDAAVRVAFTTVAPGRPTARDAKVGDNSTLEWFDARDDVLTIAPHADGAILGRAGEARFDLTWAQPISLQRGDRRLVLPHALVDYRRGAFRATGGLTKEDAFKEAQFFGLRTPRQLVEIAYDRPEVGRVQAFTTLGSTTPGAAGLRDFAQWMQGIAWQPPVGGDRLSVTLLGEVARDRPAHQTDRPAVAAAERGRLIGGSMRVKLAGSWMADAEASFAQRETMLPGMTSEAHDTAARIGGTGQLAGQTIRTAYSRVGTEFGNPGDPGLQADREQGEVAIGRQAKTWRYEFRATRARDGVNGLVSSSTETRWEAVGGTRLPGGVEATVETARQQVDRAGRELTQTKGALGLSRQWSAFHIDGRATVTETDRVALAQRERVRFAHTSLRWHRALIALTAGASMELRDHLQSMRTAAAFLQPSWQLGPRLPAVTVTLGYERRGTAVGLESTRESARGNITWRLPVSASPTLSIEAGWDRSNDRVRQISQTAHRLDIRLTVAPVRQIGPR